MTARKQPMLLANSGSPLQLDSGAVTNKFLSTRKITVLFFFQKRVLFCCFKTKKNMFFLKKKHLF